MKKKSALITGASRGIGRAAALRFAEEGYHLILICSNSFVQLKQLQKEILTKFPFCTCMIQQADAGNYEEVRSLFSKIENTFGCLDVLINNAGISHIGLLSELSAEKWNEIIQTNLSSAFYCSKLAIPLMLKQNAGKIINISSIWGISGASCEVAYSTSKGGLNAFTKALSKELAPSNIQVNAIACGVIDTKMNDFLSEAEKCSLVDQIPSGRFAAPEEVANLLLGLAEHHPYLTGQIICLDGGFL